MMRLRVERLVYCFTWGNEYNGSSIAKQVKLKREEQYIRILCILEAAR